MKVNADTKFVEFAPLLPYVVEESAKELKSAAEGKFGGVWAVTIGQLLQCMRGDFSCIGLDREHPEKMTVLQYYWIDAFKAMLEQMLKALEALVPPQTTDAKNASQSCKRMSFEEGMLVFLRDYFVLPSFAAAKELSLDDLLLAKKDVYNKAVFEMAIAKIHEQKLKAKK